MLPIPAQITKTHTSASDISNTKYLSTKTIVNFANVLIPQYTTCKETGTSRRQRIRYYNYTNGISKYNKAESERKQERATAQRASVLFLN